LNEMGREGEIRSRLLVGKRRNEKKEVQERRDRAQHPHILAISGTRLKKKWKKRSPPKNKS